MQVVAASHAGSTRWLKLQADDFEATVSTHTLATACPNSLLASLAELELASLAELELAAASSTAGSPAPAAAAASVRLDCSADVAREVVAVLRQGASYLPPLEEPRLLAALQHQLDYLGVPAPCVPTRSPRQRQAVVCVPSYWYMLPPAQLEANPSVLPQTPGLLLYSASARGWANRTGGADPRPLDLRGGFHPSSGGGCWLAAVLASEATGAEEDLAYCVPNKLQVSDRYSDQGVRLHASLSCSTFAMAPTHKRLAFSDSAMAAAQGKLYLLGGACHLQQSPSCPLEVYDAHLDSWFAARSPLPGAVALSEHSLVANQQEGLLLALGGHLTTAAGANRRRQPNSQVLSFDIKAGSWAVNPSGCTWPGGVASPASCSAVAADAWTILALAAGHSADRGGSRAVRTWLLDLRTWRWREGAALAPSSSEGSSLADRPDEPGPLNMGLCLYDGQVLAVGGRRVCEGKEVSTPKVHAYCLADDAWSELPELPFPICHASPVVMRLPSVL